MHHKSPKSRRAGWVLGVLALPSLLLAEPAKYEPGLDPAPGFNLISWMNFREDGARIFEVAVQALHDHGFREVSISPVRFVNTSTGTVSSCDQRKDCPPDAHIEAAVRKASSLGMSVTLNPFIEPEGFAFWRAELNFTGAVATRFWDDYERYIVQIATIAQRSAADRITLGTELRALTQDLAHNGRWAHVIEAVDRVFRGQIGYAANWDDYRHPNLTAAIWEHPKVDFLGIDAYHPLAASNQARGSGKPPVDVLIHRWQSVFHSTTGEVAHGILPFAAVRKWGAGMPVVLTEHGTCPYDEATAAPYSCPQENSRDPEEQRNNYEALLRAADRLRARAISAGRLDAIHIWHWKMPGAESSVWALDPSSPAAMVLREFVEPGVRGAAREFLGVWFKELDHARPNIRVAKSFIDRSATRNRGSFEAQEVLSAN